MKLISWKSLFSSKWRINEWTYAFDIFWGLIAYYITYIILATIFGLIYTPFLESQFSTLLSICLVILYRIIILINGVKRFHDKGKQVTWMLTLLIPIYGIVVWLKLMFEPWEKSKNKYWEKPKKVNKTTKILTIIFLLIYIWILILRSSM